MNALIWHTIPGLVIVAIAATIIYESKADAQAAPAGHAVACAANQEAICCMQTFGGLVCKETKVGR